MRAVVTRVKSASVEIDGSIYSSIGNGLLVLLGVHQEDTEAEALKIADKLCGLRIFEDENEKMNLSVRDVQGDVLCVSQFTLLGDARGQNRPGFTRAESPARADELYILTCEEMRKLGVRVETGVFRTHMQVTLCNDGPVTLLLDSRKTF